MEISPTNRAEYLRLRAELYVSERRVDTCHKVADKLRSAIKSVEQADEFEYVEKAEHLAGRGV